MAERGSIGIRGSGRTFTYFLRGNKDASPDMLLGRAAGSLENPAQPLKSKTKNRITRKSESKQPCAAVMEIHARSALNSNIEGFFGSCVQTLRYDSKVSDPASRQLLPVLKRKISTSKRVTGKRKKV